MSFFEKKYTFVSHRDEIHRMTAKQLCERIVQDSKSDYNWIAPASELVRVCKFPSFPTEYALTIKVAILNCFANIENRANHGGDRYLTKPADAEAVQECFNSMYGVDREDVVSARRYYLTEMLKYATYTRVFDSLYHPGETFRKLREDFITTKVEENISKKKINFNTLVESSKNEFAETVKVADSKGAFVEDEEKDKKEWAEFYKRMKDL